MKKIRKIGDPVLQQKALPVLKITLRVKKQIRAMRKILAESEGVGLASNQVGKLNRVILYFNGKEIRELINPEIIRRRSSQAVDIEGCLSIPGITLPIQRSCSIRVTGLRESGEKIDQWVTGLPARIIQHEIDHLDGILIVNRYLESRGGPRL